jgi:hypothetical protein
MSGIRLAYLEVVRFFRRCFDSLIDKSDVVYSLLNVVNPGGGTIDRWEGSELIDFGETGSLWGW